MTLKNNFIAHHIHANADDLDGNNGVGRYILLPGSDGRAKEIAEHFSHVKLKSHPRGHNLYLGTINDHGKKIDVASISSGMGCPSMEIILHELFHLGAKRFLRVGTAGSLQPELVKLGDIVSAQASVRDEDTTATYAPASIPALASLEMIEAIQHTAKKLQISDALHTGMVHCKSSFYAREFSAGPRASENNAYMHLLTECGVLATEMETATLFMQSQLYHYKLMLEGSGPTHKVLSGALLGIIAIPPDQFLSKEEQQPTIKNLTTLAIETIKCVAANDRI